MNTQSRTPKRVALALLAGVVAVPLVAAPASAHGSEVEGSGQKYYLSNTLGSEGGLHSFGRETDETFVGDWDGNGTDTLAVRRGSMFYIDNSGDGGNHDSQFSYGRHGDHVVVGDWDGNGTDTLGVRRGASFHLTNAVRGGRTDSSFDFIAAQGPVVSGDWNNSGRDGVGVRVGNAAYLRNADSSSQSVTFGRTGDTLFAGDFNGDGADTLAVRRPAPAPAPAPVAAAAAEAAPSSAGRVISSARSKIGSRYVYGASGPSSFDCSGLTSYVYRSGAGINLPRNSSGQRAWAAANGRQVSMAQAKPGDLLYWPGHVAVYTGNGKMVDAGNPTVGISERRVYGSPQVFRIL